MVRVQTGNKDNEDSGDPELNVLLLDPDRLNLPADGGSTEEVTGVRGYSLTSLRRVSVTKTSKSRLKPEAYSF